MEHLVTKKVRRGSRRLFFDNPVFKTGRGELLMTFFTVLGIELYYGKCVLEPQSGWFYVDMPLWRYRLMTRATFLYWDKPVWSKCEVKLTKKYENVTVKIW